MSWKMKKYIKEELIPELNGQPKAVNNTPTVTLNEPVRKSERKGFDDLFKTEENGK